MARRRRRWGRHSPDPRDGRLRLAHPGAGGFSRQRPLVWSAPDMVDTKAYDAPSHRPAGVPRGGRRFQLWATRFPHENQYGPAARRRFRQRLLYIGQEVVSRMQHRGTARAPASCACSSMTGRPRAGRRDPRRPTSRWAPWASSAGGIGPRADPAGSRRRRASTAAVPLLAGGIVIPPRRARQRFVSHRRRTVGMTRSAVLHPDGPDALPVAHPRDPLYGHLSRHRMGRARI